METFMSELPLMIFTFCVLLGAGGYMASGIEHAVRRLPAGESLQDASVPNEKIDRRPVVYFLVIIVGFVAVFFHLASPVNAAFVLTGVGRSPLSNEVAVGMIFTVAALLYSFLKTTGRLRGAADRVCSIVLAILGVLFVAFTGAAYMMETIVTWNSPLNIIESVGLSLFAGAILAASLRVLLAAGFPSKAERTALLVAAVTGFVVGFGALGLHVSQAGGLHSGMVQGSALVQVVMVPFAVSVGAGLASLLVWLRMPSAGEAKKTLLIAVIVLIVISVFAARLVFYGLQLSVGF